MKHDRREIKKMGYKILFIGDSITDCNRSVLNHGLGDGYVYEIANVLKDQQIINKGISGNRMIDLKKRWKRDMLTINPDFLTILIGINDLWHKHAFGKRFSIAKFEETYRELITSSLQNRKDLKIILMTPFYLPFGAYHSNWDQEFEQIMNVCHKLAIDYRLTLVNLHETINNANHKYQDTELLYDGVHPTPLGHRIIKDTWLTIYHEITKDM